MKASELWEGGKCGFVFSSDLLKAIHFHDLRHTVATDLINRGANTYSISKRLGHANIKTTMNIYGHYLEETDQKIADMLDENYI